MYEHGEVRWIKPTESHWPANYKELWRLRCLVLPLLQNRAQFNLFGMFGRYCSLEKILSVWRKTTSKMPYSWFHTLVVMSLLLSHIVEDDMMTCSAKLSADKDGSCRFIPSLAYLSKHNMEYLCLIYVSHVHLFPAANTRCSMRNASQRYSK